MRSLLSFLVITFSLFICIESFSYGKHISIRDAPYTVAFVDPNNNNLYTCGGSIISEYWIVTAAHCFTIDIPSNQPIGVIFGGTAIGGELSYPSTIYLIKKIFIHPGYHQEYSTSENDLALVEVERPMVLNIAISQSIKIRKIPPRENDTVVVIGFYQQDETEYKGNLLRKSEVAIVDETTCKAHTTKSYPNLDVMVRTVFCAGNGTSDVCYGDIGSPAVIDGELAGLVSFGPPCNNYSSAHTHGPVVYTRLDIFYDWIVEITGIVF